MESTSILLVEAILLDIEIPLAYRAAMTCNGEGLLECFAANARIRNLKSASSLIQGMILHVFSHASRGMRESMHEIKRVLRALAMAKVAPLSVAALDLAPPRQIQTLLAPSVKHTRLSSGAFMIVYPRTAITMKERRPAFSLTACSTCAAVWTPVTR